MTAGDADGVVLLVEHEPRVAELARRYLAREGFEVEIEQDTGRAPGTIRRLRPDAVVLDLSGAGDPAALYERVAGAARPAPVVATTDPDPPSARRLGPHRVVRPFGPRELVAAVTAALDGGVPRAESAAPLRAGGLTVDRDGRTVRAGDRSIALTTTEFDLLEHLAAHPGRVFTREQLLAAAWETGFGSGSRTVDVHVAQLRAKLGEGNPIRTVRGVGYVLDG